MKQHILPALKITLLCILLFSGLYTLLIWGIAQIMPGRGEGETLKLNGRVVGYALEGQSFTKDVYFWGRPSAVSYSPDGSGGSSKGPSNPAYLADVKDRIKQFLSQNPGIQSSDIPADLVTASGSGLDPDISVAAALVQIPRISRVRGITKDRLKYLVEQSEEAPVLGVLGTRRVNVLKLNISLDSMKP
jgi:K+-transporting ATPase ATPase C chain